MAFREPTFSQELRQAATTSHPTTACPGGQNDAAARGDGPVSHHGSLADSGANQIEGLLMFCKLLSPILILGHAVFFMCYQFSDANSTLPKVLKGHSSKHT